MNIDKQKRLTQPILYDLDFDGDWRRLERQRAMIAHQVTMAALSETVDNSQVSHNID